MMVTLGEKEVEATKLAAIITNALTWIVNNVPDALVPPELLPAFELVKSLAPYLAYIGGFIAWSWSEIQSFDIGNGVTLTATWLLPIALIPGTWENEDVPTPAPTTPPATTPSSSDPTDSTPPATGQPSATPPTAPSTEPTAPTAPSTEPTSPEPSAPSTTDPTAPASSPATTTTPEPSTSPVASSTGAATD